MRSTARLTGEPLASRSDDGEVQCLKFKVGVVLQDMDLVHVGALLRVREGSFLDVLVQLDGSTGRVGNGAGTADAAAGQPMPSSR